MNMLKAMFKFVIAITMRPGNKIPNLSKTDSKGWIEIFTLLLVTDYKVQIYIVLSLKKLDIDHVPYNTCLLPSYLPSH